MRGGGRIQGAEGGGGERMKIRGGPREIGKAMTMG